MWDAFISHASEDKDLVVRPLTTILVQGGLRVWYDEFALSVGDSLRRSIDHGLADSRFGVVILSQRFFEKQWPQQELDGLISRESSTSRVVLPVWHNISRDDVAKYSPILADRIAVSTSQGLDVVAQHLLSVIKPTDKAPKDISTHPYTETEFILRAMAGNDKGKVFPLNRPRLIVGRTLVADISLNEPDISRWHFSIRWEPNEGCHIVQDGHAHGTVVNGRLLLSGGECRIKVGDEIKVGSTILRYEKL